MSDRKSDPLLEPFKIGNLSLRNRIVSTAHAPNFQIQGHPRDRYRRYHAEKARGGVALTMVGGSTNIAPDSPSVFGQLYAGDDSILTWFRQLTDEVHQHGAAIICQITHMGRRTAWDDGHWLPVISASGVRELAHRAMPKAMEIEDFERVIAQFAATALRVKMGGFDGVEILSHSHLLGQFLSPLVNRRQDDFGGSSINRMRLTFRVLEAVRAAVGPDFIVGMRLTGDELEAGGLDGDECVEIAHRLAGHGSIDFLNILAGAPYDDLGLATWVPPMGMPSAAHITVAGRIREAVSLPIIHAGGMADLASARHAVDGGHVDLVGMTRAQLADPYLVQKLQRGEEARIRPCVGLGYCVDRVNQGKDAVCGHNAATGREATLSHFVPKSEGPKHRIVVVGGGVGGMEAARVCALRGHSVELFEADSRLGGQVLLASQGTTRRQILGVTEWLAAELDTLNVPVHFNSPMESQDVLDLNPDVVIVATGGWPSPLEVPGGYLAISSWNVLSKAVRISPGSRVLLFDERGDQAGSVCADVLAKAGAVVTMVTPDRAIAHELGPTNSAVVVRDLAKQGVEFQTLQSIKAIQKTGNQLAVSLEHVLSKQVRDLQFEHCIIENATVPSDDLYFALKPFSSNKGQLDHKALIHGKNPFTSMVQSGDCSASQCMLARIGDAVTARNIHAAIFDAARVCQHL